MRKLIQVDQSRLITRPGLVSDCTLVMLVMWSFCIIHVIITIWPWTIFSNINWVAQYKVVKEAWRTGVSRVSTRSLFLAKLYFVL